MIPIKNKKKTLKATVEEMRNFSFIYIEKYAPSKQQLKTYLLKKYLKAKISNINKKNINDLIDVVLEDLERTKFINDKFYSNSRAKALIQRDQDFFSAIKVCKKKRIGPSRDENNRELFYKKDIGILARSGFDFDTSKKVMELDKDDYLKIINLL